MNEPAEAVFPGIPKIYNVPEVSRWAAYEAQFRRNRETAILYSPGYSDPPEWQLYVGGKYRNTFRSREAVLVELQRIQGGICNTCDYPLEGGRPTHCSYCGRKLVYR